MTDWTPPMSFTSANLPLGALQHFGAADDNNQAAWGSSQATTTLSFPASDLPQATTLSCGSSQATTLSFPQAPSDPGVNEAELPHAASYSVDLDVVNETNDLEVEPAVTNAHAEEPGIDQPRVMPMDDDAPGTDVVSDHELPMDDAGPGQFGCSKCRNNRILGCRRCNPERFAGKDKQVKKRPAAAAAKAMRRPAAASTVVAPEGDDMVFGLIQKPAQMLQQMLLML